MVEWSPSERESKTLEFKSDVKKFDKIIKTCVAFANGVGGKIIIGIDDKTHQIIGINDKIRDKFYDDFPNCLYDSTSPHLIPQIYEQRINDNAILILEIPPTLKKPCFIRQEGLPKGVYLRIGSSTRRASEEYIIELMRENHRISYDGETIAIAETTLCHDLLTNYYKKINQAALLEDKMIARSNTNPEIFYPTVAGILLFSAKPCRYIPEAHILCTRFAGTEGRDIIQTEEVQGPITKQLDVTFNLVMAWLKRHYHLVDARLACSTLLPAEAVREAICNALMHRKYWIPGAIKISLFDDHLEIFSPGNFPGHININQLQEGITHLRNPILTRMAHKMHIIEKLGSGIKLIFHSCQQAGIVAPEFREDGDYVKVIFRFALQTLPQQTDAEKLLKLLQTTPVLTINDIIAYLGRSKNTTHKVIKQLIDAKQVIRIGQGRATRYALNSTYTDSK